MRLTITVTSGNDICLRRPSRGDDPSGTVDLVIVGADGEKSVRGCVTLANGDIASVSTGGCGGGKAATGRAVGF